MPKFVPSYQGSKGCGRCHSCWETLEFPNVQMIVFDDHRRDELWLCADCFKRFQRKFVVADEHAFHYAPYVTWKGGDMSKEKSDKSGFTPPEKDGPLPSSILRPLKQPLYDSEWLRKGVPVTEVRFYQRSLAQRFLFAKPKADYDQVKTSADTNLSQPGQLANPLEFSVFAFAMHYHGLNDVVRAEMLRECNMMFVYAGNRVYLSVPGPVIPEIEDPTQLDLRLPVIPQVLKRTTDFSEPELAAIDAGAKETYESFMKQCWEDDSKRKLYSFTIARSALRIRPTESFQFRISWDREPYVPPCDIKITNLIIGLQWTPL